jgi:hypothetical protein
LVKSISGGSIDFWLNLVIMMDFNKINE